MYTSTKVPRGPKSRDYVRPREIVETRQLEAFWCFREWRAEKTFSAFVQLKIRMTTRVGLLNYITKASRIFHIARIIVFIRAISVKVSLPFSSLHSRCIWLLHDQTSLSAIRARAKEEIKLFSLSRFSTAKLCQFSLIILLNTLLLSFRRKANEWRGAVEKQNPRGSFRRSLLTTLHKRLFRVLFISSRMNYFQLS